MGYQFGWTNKRNRTLELLPFKVWVPEGMDLIFKVRMRDGRESQAFRVRSTA